MGFAGQVFAARVAIGLAVPSARSLTSTGHMIGKAAANMYTNINQLSVKAAKQRTADTLKSLNESRARVEQFQSGTQSKLLKSAAASINKTNKLYANNLAKGAKQVTAMKTNVRKMTRGTGAAPKLFEGIKKDMTSSKQYAKMLKNFTFMHRDERRAVLEAVKAHAKLAAQRAQEAVDMAKQGKVSKEYARNLIRDAQQKENTYKQYAQADKDRTIVKQKLDRQGKQLQKELTAAEKEYTKALDEEGLAIQEVSAGAQRMYERTQQFVYELKTGFLNGLRESISVLTAFYYKLNENAMELAEFERELLNANSVFALTRDELFATSQAIVQFSQEFGLAMDNGAAGLYQLASAGLSAEEAMQVLPETLKLSMAVQGDHNTISKLTTQTLFGFGMEVSEAGELTDKFAHAIQKSLIEYQDLTSAIKFALPFFTATGQSIDQLLGSLQVLTNRALEAGIAGRGLRQALAEFAESAEDNEAAFRSMGIDILNAEGEMKQLTEIAKEFAAVVGPETASNTELLTTLIQDLNVRGATAFIHLVQNAEEFEQAVLDTKNAGGELDEMVRIQNESITAQMQILKNNIRAVFTMRDANADGTETINEFHQGILDLIASMRNLIVTEQHGEYVLTSFGRNLREISITGIQAFHGVAVQMVEIIERFTEAGFLNISMLKAYFVPLKIVLDIVERLGPNFIKIVIWMRILNSLLPIGMLANWAYQASVEAIAAAEAKRLAAQAAAATGQNALNTAVAAGTANNMAFSASLANPVKMLGRFLKMLTSRYVILAAVVATFTALSTAVINLKGAFSGFAIATKDAFRMFKEALSPITVAWFDFKTDLKETFGYFGEDDSRRMFLSFFQEFYAVLATLVKLVAELFVYIVKLAAGVIKWQFDVILGPTARKLLEMYDYIMDNNNQRQKTHLNLGMQALGWSEALNEKLRGSRGETFLGEANYSRWGAGIGAGLGTALGLGIGFATAPVTGGASVPAVSVGLVPALAAGGAAIGGGIGEWIDRRQAGGYMTPRRMQAGGYLVGERGPELFMPRMGGKILNTDRTRSLLEGQTSGAITGNGVVANLVVGQLTANNSVSKQSKISVDTFAGVV